MAGSSRAGTMVLLVGGLLLAGLMLYVLNLRSSVDVIPSSVPKLAAGSSSRPVSGVAVFLPTREGWLNLSYAARRVAAAQGAEILDETESSFEIQRTADNSRVGGRQRLHFYWVPVVGTLEIEDAVDDLALSSSTRAVIGSDTTLLTVALASALSRARSRFANGGPVLLIPWASSAEVRATQGQAPLPLLDIYPGRAFRFCADNRSEANLVVRALTQAEPDRPPARAVIMVDANDPFSLDLAAGFRQAIDAQTFKKPVEFTELSFPENLAALSETDPPTLAELLWADRVWGLVTRIDDERTLWLALPMQERPARRLLQALRLREPSRAMRPNSEEPPLRVLTGDSVDVDLVAELAGTRAFSLWCFSAAPARPSSKESSSTAARRDDSVGVWLYAEIVSALLRCGSAPPSKGRDEDSLRDCLRTLRITPDPSAAAPALLSRSLAFSPSGERELEGFGYVVSTSQSDAAVTARALQRSGQWTSTILNSSRSDREPR